MALLNQPVTVRVPATSANLGPGFDALGLALTRYDEVTAEIAEAGTDAVTIEGEGAGELPTDATHLVIRVMRRTFDLLGEAPAGIGLHCVNSIPQARGMGSSSAAIVAGILLARALVRDGSARLDDAGMLRLAAEIEGHPDNVAPCLLGGATIAWTGPAGAEAVRFPVEPTIRPYLFVPSERSLTEAARAALPATVPHADAALNAGRAALLVHALGRAPAHLFAATEDRLHQTYRAPGMPQSAALVASLRADGVAAVVSGAGPTVLVLAVDGWRAPEVSGWSALALGVDEAGGAVIDGRGGAMLEHAERDPVAAGRAS
jgi:homoserine kinase